MAYKRKNGQAADPNSPNKSAKMTDVANTIDYHSDSKDLDADLVLVSSDNVGFRTHKAGLQFARSVPYLIVLLRRTKGH